MADASAELWRALAVALDPIDSSQDSAAIFELLELGELPPPGEREELLTFQLYPYASVYLGEEGMLGGEARDRVAGFWRAFGATPPNEPDHLGSILGLYAHLVELVQDDQDPARDWRTAQAAFFWEHMVSWLPAYLRRVQELGSSFWRGWAELLTDLMCQEAGQLPAPERLSLHLRASNPLDHPEGSGGEAFLKALLAPVRSGMILTRADIRRCATELELGGRIGERRFMLQALLSQNAPAALRWLATLARQAAVDHEVDFLDHETRALWHGRASATSELFDQLAGEAQDNRHD